MLSIQQFSQEQKQQLASLGIEVVYLFGSQTTGEANEKSDFDFGVVLSRSFQNTKSRLSAYEALYEILSAALPKEYLEKRMRLGLHEFDIVFLDKANKKLRHTVTMTGEVLFESYSSAAADCKERAMLDYFDFQFFERIQLDALFGSKKRHIS